MIDSTISYWHKTAEAKEYPPLEKDIETDTLIIGGGISGVTCAYCLSQKGPAPVLIEAGGLCDGTTGNTTGKATIQHGLIYDRIAKEHDKEAAKTYAKAQTEAVDFIKEVVKKENIECQLAENTAYIYASTDEEADMVRREYETAVDIGIDAYFSESEHFPPNNKCLLGYRNQAVIHAVRYVDGLAKAAVKNGAKLYCGTKAVKVEDGDIIKVTCQNGVVIRTKHLVMATQYPIYDGMGFYFTRLFAKRSYGIAVDAETDWPDGSYINLGTPTRSIRTHVEDGKRILIVVGEGHHTARGEDNMALHYDNLVKFANTLAGVKKVLAYWSAQDYKTPDEIPYIGKISSKSSIFIASGYGKWGISTGTLSGMIISEIIAHGGSRYEDLFSPERADITSKPGDFLSENLGIVGELIKSKVEKCEGLENMKPGEGRVIRYNGKKAGLYVDEDGNAIIVDITCTHMTTELNFNSAERTWDCPAHGGRFAVDGRLLEGPPKNPLKVLFRGRFTDLEESGRK